MLFGGLSEAAITCEDCDSFKVSMHHHIQDHYHSIALGEQDKVTPMVAALTQVVTELDNGLGGDFKFSLINSTDKETVDTWEHCNNSTIVNVPADEAVTDPRGVAYRLPAIYPDYFYHY